PDAPSQKGEIQASGNQFGGKLTSPPFNEEATGFSSNHYIVTPTFATRGVVDADGQPVIDPDTGEQQTEIVATTVVFSGSDPSTGKLIQPGFTPANGIEPGAPEYPIRFRIDADAIEDEVRDLATVTATNVFVVAPPNDEFTMTA
ncbi:MAG TPA: hypothetical protein VII92_12850, partial [Anaerolineae bacterium]